VRVAVVMNEAHFFEFTQEKIDARARCPDHFRQHLLRHVGDNFLRLALLAITSEGYAPGVPRSRRGVNVYRGDSSRVRNLRRTLFGLARKPETRTGM